MDSFEARKVEQRKYRWAYSQQPNYKMGQKRMLDAVNDLRGIPARGSYLDVSCGRGEMLRHARHMGFLDVRGTEIVPDLIDGETVVKAWAHDLPFGDRSFEVVTMFDVIEHLIAGDDRLACEELARVASRHVLLTANNRPSFNKNGDDLHINKRPYEEWDALFRDWFPGAVTWIKGSRHYVSEAWRVDL